jgi:hypothetical protein
MHLSIENGEPSILLCAYRCDAGYMDSSPLRVGLLGYSYIPLQRIFNILLALFPIDMVVILLNANQYLYDQQPTPWILADKTTHTTVIYKQADYTPIISMESCGDILLVPSNVVEQHANFFESLIEVEYLSIRKTWDRCVRDVQSYRDINIICIQ